METSPTDPPRPFPWPRGARAGTRVLAVFAVLLLLGIAPTPMAAPPGTPDAGTPDASHGAASGELVSSAASPTPARAAVPLPPNTVSPRNASYTLEARLDPESRIVEGRGSLRWRNLQAAPTAELPFHLYWNGFRNAASTWMREDRLRGRSDLKEPREGDWGWIEVTSMRLGGDAGGNAELALRYEDPDIDDLDGANSEDRTVLVATLLAAVGSGEEVEVDFIWRARVPRTFARTGYRGDFFFLAHWFPKLAVYEAEGWNRHAFHAATEFYSDYGDYDVTLTVPAGFVVGATGREVDNRENGDGTVSHRYTQQDVHAFTWTTSPDYAVHERHFEAEGLPSVEMRLLIQPEHLNQVDRHFRATAAALEHYGRWYGAYPYGHITIVDPAYGSGAGGMEYPTLFTSGTGLFRPFGGGSPEGVTIHEAGHQFWYGLVGNNEFEHAWLDEGLNTFSTARVYAEVYGDEQYTKSYLEPPAGDFGGFVRVLFPEVRESRWIYGNRWHRFFASDAPTAGAQSDPTYLYHPANASRLSYDKSALWLSTLERHLGWETLQPILATFFERYRFRHPGPDDFFAVANEVAGQDLSWFFDQVHRSSVTFDYAVEAISSEPIWVEGMVEGEEGPVYQPSPKDSDAEEETYRSEVVVRRHGEGIFPVEVLLVFEDGQEVRHAWEGRERYKVFTEVGPAKLRHAVVDPERVLLLDQSYLNNSRVREPDAAFPARKWASKWMIWLQDYLAAFTFFS